ncbi:hypothetical protein JVT61DRAFT_7634 [Boletus reticuloceps]|uniref:Uncharacterized protein n=1 Tax=Boletus reticuloceps TaxID=495285 RepID=A0A8I3A606_9AGAM|nr:hypothetical protein JVT61DRAFT_7634 [Boletus reticuloceps]
MRKLPAMSQIADIRSLLKSLPLDTIQTIEQITPHQFKTLWRAFQGERGRLSFNAKFLYLEEERKLLIMNPSFAHEGFVVLLSRLVTRFLSTLGHDEHMFDFIVATNMGLRYTNGNNIRRMAKPDFQVHIENNHSGKFTPKWIGEVSFTVSPTVTRNNLRQVIAHQPHVDLAFMIIIKEDPKWASPGSENYSEALHQLRSQPLLTHEEFVLNVGDDFGSVVKGGFAWISIQEITIELYLRSSSGSLVIDDARQDEDSAYGTLYPTNDMLGIDLLLLDGSNNLRDSLVLEMEGTDASAASIGRVRQSMANLVIDWDYVLLSYRSVLLTAAYQRYQEWHRPDNSVSEWEDLGEHTTDSSS